MTRRNGRHRGRRDGARSQLVETGFLSLVAAGALWLGSLVLGGSPVLAPVAGALRSIVWLPLTVGVVLLGIHFLVQRKAGSSINAGDEPAARPTRKPFAAMRSVPVNSPAQRPSRHPKPTNLRDTRFGHNPDKPSTKISGKPSPVETVRSVEAETVPYKQARWSPEVFASIEWRRFEAVVEALFAQAGFETRSQSHGADGGVDVWLYSKNAEGPVSVVQCKHWRGQAITVKEMREFLGVMVSKGVRRGTYATTSRYTADALEFAKAHGINAQDGNGLLQLIAQRTTEQQTQLLEVAYEGEYWKPTCASCGVKMRERTSGKDSKRFWGCGNYPRCKRTLPMKAT